MLLFYNGLILIDMVTLKQFFLSLKPQTTHNGPSHPPSHTTHNGCCTETSLSSCNRGLPTVPSLLFCRPIDLSTIKKRIETGELRTTVEFQRDLLLMFQNAIMYNNSRSLVYKMASIMQNECLQHIEVNNLLC